MNAITTLAQTSNAELFAFYAKSAAREDLRAYVTYAARKLARYELPDTTIAIIGEMTATLRGLEDRDGKPADKKAVWALIDRFKASIPGFAGSAGAEGSWADDVPPWSWEYACEMSRRVAITVQLPTFHGTIDHNDVAGAPRYQGNPWEKFEAHRRAVADARHAQVAAEALHHFRLPMRIAPLCETDVQVIIDAATPGAAPAKVVAKRKPVKTAAVATLPCPSCAGPLALDTMRCASCGTAWALTPVKPHVTRQVKRQAKAQIQPRTQDANGRLQCNTCSSWQDEIEYRYGDGGRTVRRMCKRCHRAQQAARRHAA